jgi:hypothetical protein
MYSEPPKKKKGKLGKTKSEPPKKERELRIHVPIDNTKGKKLFPKFDTTRDPEARVHCTYNIHMTYKILNIHTTSRTRKT